MSPVLDDGDYVITSRFKKLRPGVIVVVHHPIYKTMVKRVLEVNDQGQFRLTGENILSVTSEQMGWCSRDCLAGVVLFTLR